MYATSRLYMESNPVSIHAIHTYINLLQHHACMETPIVIRACNYTYNSIFMSSQCIVKFANYTFVIFIHFTYSY